MKIAIFFIGLFIYMYIYKFPLIRWKIHTVSLWKAYYKDNMFGYIVLLLTSNEYLKDISCSITLPFGYKYRWLCSTVWNNGKLLPFKRLEYIDEILCKISRIWWYTSFTKCMLVFRNSYDLIMILSLVHLYRSFNFIISLVTKNLNIDVVSSSFSFYTYFLSALKNVWNSMKI